MKIAVLMPDNAVRNLFIPPQAAQELETLGTVRWNDGGYEPHTLKQLLEGADICVTGWGCPILNEDLLGNKPSLRLVAHTGGTVAPIVSDFLYDQGIRVISGNEIYAESVAEGTVAYMLTALRRIPYYNGLVQQGHWKDTSSKTEGLLDRKVGLVGFGAIARKLVPMLRAFKVDIMVYDPHIDDETCATYSMARAHSMEEVFSENDIVSLHLPRTQDTYHVVNSGMLSRLRDGALLVNTARGSVVDEEALAGELATGRISGILDVYETEPLPIDSKLRGLDNVILIPHMAGPTTDRCARVASVLIEDIRRMEKGHALKHEISRDYAMKMTNDTLKITSL